MPKSKRNKVMTLTKVKKKNIKDYKQGLLEKIKKNLGNYENIYVFNYENMTTVSLRKLQTELTDSKFLFGKNKLIKIALGRDENDEFGPNSHLLSQYLKGDCGLFLTNKSKEEVMSFFGSYIAEEFAKAEHVADRTIILKKGFEDLKQFGHSMESHLRKLGLNTSLINSQIHLNEDVMIAEKGQPLNTEQAKILVSL